MNKIQHKLKIFDKQLSKENWLLTTIQRRPLLLPAIGLVVGIFTSSLLPAIFALSAFAILCLFSISLYLILSEKRKEIAIFIVCFAFAFLGALRLVDANKYSPSNISSLEFENKIPVEIKATISSIPSRKDYRHWLFSSFNWGKSPYHFTIDLEEIKTENGWQKINGKLYTTLNSQENLDFEVGDNIEATGWLNKLSEARNIGGFDFKKYMSYHGIRYRLGISNQGYIKRIDSKSFGEIKYYGRRFMQRLHQRAEPINIKHSKLLNALISGYRSEVDSKVIQDFRRSGLLHLLSLSGLHVALLLSIVWLITRTIGIRKHHRAIICIAFCLGFVYLVEPRPPIVRAATIAIIFFLAIVLKRKPDILNTLSLSAIGLLLYNPFNLFMVGFELSFVTIISIVLFQEQIRFAIDSLTGFRFFDVKNKSLIHRFISHNFSLLSVGIAAWIGSAGIIAYYFCSIYPLSAIWTCIALPFFTLTLSAQLVRLVVAITFPSAIALVNPIVNFFAEVMTELVAKMSSVSISEIIIAAPSKTIVFSLYIAIALLLLSISKMAFRRLLKPSLLIICAISFLMLYHIQNSSDSLTITTFSIGKGYCTFIEQADENLLINCGSSSVKDLGRSTITPYLRRRGITKIENIILTDLTLKCVNGLDGVLEYSKPDNLYCTQNLILQKESSRLAYTVNELAREKSVPMKQMPPSINIGCAEIKNVSKNPDKLDLIIEFAGKKFKLPTAKNKMTVTTINSDSKED